jgi:hypothetical protein
MLMQGSGVEKYKKYHTKNANAGFRGVVHSAPAVCGQIG